MSSLPWPPRGALSTQEFHIRDPRTTLLSAYLRFVPLLILLFFIMTALGSLPFGGRLLPGLGIGFVVTAFFVWRLYTKARKGFLSTVLRMSPTGVEWWDDYGFYVRLRWEQITRMGEVLTAVTKPGARVGVPGGVQLTVRPWKNTGLIGWGERRIPQKIPGWMRDVIARTPRDERTGAVEVAIPLSGLDVAWATGPIGDWVRHYRPDLFPSGR